MPEAVDFKITFCARIRALRIACGMTQAEMAQALGIGSEAYRSYETRSLMPHHLVETFARITGIEIAELFGDNSTPSLHRTNCT